MRRRAVVHDGVLVPFPPGKSGGLIEALSYRSRVRLGLARWFPPGKSGGLIEAFPTWEVSAGGIIGEILRIQSGFRRVNPAASLKRPNSPAVGAGPPKPAVEGLVSAG